MSRQALVVGATGGVGGAVAARLVARGWRVRALHRFADLAREGSGRPDLEWIQGDALVEADVMAAAQGAELLVHAVNPPGYRNWAALQMPMLASSIAAARAADARLILPGTIYNFGPDAFPTLSEASPQNPVTRKGHIRAQMEDKLAAASAQGLKVLIVRCGDFFGPAAGNNWLSQGLVRPGRPITAVQYPGPLEFPHTWAYLPDVAEAMVGLAESFGLGDFEVFHMRGHVLTGREMVAALEAAAGHRLKIRRMPWFALRLAAPFNETLREMLEIQYLWREPLELENAKLRARLGQEPHTEIVDALRATLVGIGALPQISASGRKAATASALRSRVVVRG